MGSLDDTQIATLDAAAADRAQGRGGAVTLVFRWQGGRTTVDLEADTLVVGRSSRCDLTLPDPSLSRQHARFERTASGLRVEDLGSRNGVELAGAAVSSAEIGAGDVVMLGNVSVSVHVFEASADDAAATRAQGDVSWAGAAMQPLLREIRKIAPTPLPVLITGETGCGKEVVAREVHRLSQRDDKPLVVVNCAAIPATLVESTLFGHVRGAFTGADSNKAGVFEQARGGTVFLDELGELPLAAQAVLLRVLESERFTPVGSTREVEADVRVIAATHRDLPAMVQAGQFRLDLLHRLDTVTLHLPPLRERPDALEPLIELFLQRASKKMQKSPRRVSPAVLALMQGYAFPGNVRELRNVIERAVAISDTPLLSVDDLPPRLRGSTGSPSFAPAPAASRSEPPGPPSESPDARPTQAPLTAKERKAQQERAQLIRALEQTRGSQPEAAELLGWSLRTLQRRVQQYGLSKPRRGS